MTNCPPASVSQGSLGSWIYRVWTHDQTYTGTLALPALKKLFTRETILVVALVLGWAYTFDDVLEWFPKMVVAQLRVHQWLFSSDRRKSHVRWVTPVEVDDDTFYGPHCSGTIPTNRAFLGDLALKVAEQSPAVIAFDFQWKGMNGRAGDAQIRDKDNEHLLEAIAKITATGIPVVVTTGLARQADGSWIRQANVYEDSSLPTGALVGHINLPIDKRKIALKMKSWDWRHTRQDDLNSLSLQVISAYESELGIWPRTVDDNAIKNSATREWVFGGFFEPSAFPSISAQKLLDGDLRAASLCRHRIVLIGGTWHNPDGTLIESFPSPVGVVPGLFLHANYIESLLDNRFKQAVPKWLAVMVDFCLAMLMYLSFHSVTRTSKRIGVLAAFLLPLTIAYFLFANAGRYLDFMIPLSLCFIDLVRQTVKLRLDSIPH